MLDGGEVFSIDCLSEIKKVTSSRNDKKGKVPAGTGQRQKDSSTPIRIIVPCSRPGFFVSQIYGPDQAAANRGSDVPKLSEVFAISKGGDGLVTKPTGDALCDIRLRSLV